jgi:hypothetical protein
MGNLEKVAERITERREGRRPACRRILEGSLRQSPMRVDA